MARLTDGYGNPVPGRGMRFYGGITGACATFPAGDTAVTDAHGRATVRVQASAVAGTYNIVAHLNENPLPSGALFQLSNFSNLQAWRAQNFSGTWQSTGDAANGAMPFNDSVPNLLKYAFNLNPQAADYAVMQPEGTRGLPLVGMDQQRRLTVTFVRRKATTFPSIDYTVVFASDLRGAFTVNPAATMTTPVSIDATWERVTVTDSVSAVGAGARRFVRVQVSEL